MLTTGENKNGLVTEAAFTSKWLNCPLGEVIRDIVEAGIQLGADDLDRADDDDADESGEKAVFDCGGARLVPQKPCEDTLHNLLLAPFVPRPAQGRECGRECAED